MKVNDKRISGSYSFTTMFTYNIAKTLSVKSRSDRAIQLYGTILAMILALYVMKL